MKTAPTTPRTFDTLRMMSATALAIFAATCLSAGEIFAQDGLSSEPYSVFVAYDKAFARCGPSSEYYRTDSLRHGQELEVYVETKDGWLGVRPPEESFCWVPASTVKTSDRGQTGEVIEDRTVAWIGTNLGRAKRYRWQVRLAKGEPVSIIGRSEREGPDGPQLWYRIVPPSGEFRWVHRDQIVTSAEELVAKADGPESESLLATKPDRGTRPSMSRFGNLADRGKSILAKAISENPDHEPEPRVAAIQPATSSRQTELQVAELLSPTRSPEVALPIETARSTPGAERSSRRKQASIAQPLVAADTPTLRAAPTPQRIAAEQIAPQQIAPEPIAAIAPESPPTAAIGSGLRPQEATAVPPARSVATAPQPHQATWPAPVREPIHAPVRGQTSILPEADFVSRPRLIDIGATVPASAPSAADVASDGNWITGNTRQAADMGVQSPTQSMVMAGQATTSAPNAYGPNAYGPNTYGPNAYGPNAYGPNTYGPNAYGPNAYGPFAGTIQTVAASSPKVVSQSDIDAIAAEANQAGVEQLHLILSRLMANRATSIEAQPIADAADALAISSDNDLVTARARLLSERVAQYQRVAERRDQQTGVQDGVQTGVQAGVQAVVQAGGNFAGGYVFDSNAMASSSLAPPVIPASAQVPLGNPSFSSSMNQSLPTPRAAVAPVGPSATGYLVQVYSARQNSPPYALTDNVGSTIAYVTPAPGVNLRHHINSEVTVSGNQGYVQGLNTPHIVAQEAIRVASTGVQQNR